MNYRGLAILGSVAVGAVWAPNANAQSTEGFALNRFDPSERGSDWFSTESLDLRGHNRTALGLVVDWAHKPLVLYKPNGDEQSAIVENQLFAHLGASHIMWDRLRLAVSLPVAPYVSGEGIDGPATELTSKSKSTIGDLRLGADVRLLGTYGSAFTSAIGLQVHLPTGNQDAFTGDGKARIVPRATAAGDIGPFAYSARLGVNFRMNDQNFDGQPFGTELLFGAAAGLRMADKKLVLGPELYGSTVVSDGGDGAFDRKTTPFEIIFGGHYAITPDWRIGAGVGPGLTRGVGSPKVRVLASLEWFPAYDEKTVPKSDRDRDGILDDEDACPDVKGVASDDPAKNGCPPDRDKDGILDVDDACPDEPGVASDDKSKHGCPLPPDRDKDGILDAEDACPDVPGDKHDDPKKNGCPPPKDTDGDGIFDDQDACPDKAGPANSDPKQHGCPRAVIIGKQIKILDRVEFDTNKATIRPDSDAILQAVLKILQDHPEIKKVSVEGHTDNRGNPALNTILSRNRAAAVVKWLTSRGIEGARLQSSGFGASKPIDANTTDEGRQNNRRVEFHIVDDKK